MPTNDAYVAIVRAIWDAGDAVLPIDSRLPEPAKQRLLSIMRPHAIRSTSGEHALPDPLETEIGDALVIATSGSTGDPKGVVHTMDGLVASARATTSALGVTRDDRWLACLPVAHIGGFSVISRAMLTDTALEVHDGFDAVRVNASDSTLTSLVATALARVDATRFRRILIGGSRPPEQRPSNCVATYGMTETGSGVVYDGFAIPDVELTVFDGEIAVRGPMLMRGYRDGSTSIDANGWLRTGDAGRLDEDGRLHVDGRIGDVIVSGGEKIWPESVERAIADRLNDFAVVKLPDPEWGERVLLVHTDVAPSLEEIRDLVKQSLPAYCAPTAMVRVESIPRTASGKVRRSDLAAVVRDMRPDQRH